MRALCSPFTNRPRQAPSQGPFPLACFPEVASIDLYLIFYIIYRCQPLQVWLREGERDKGERDSRSVLLVSRILNMSLKNSLISRGRSPLGWAQKEKVEMYFIHRND